MAFFDKNLSMAGIGGFSFRSGIIHGGNMRFDISKKGKNSSGRHILLLLEKSSSWEM